MHHLGRALVACFACVGLSNPAVAANWLEVGVATDGVRAYIDTDSLSGGNGWVRVSQRFVIPRAHRRPLDRVDQQVVYVCATRTVKTLKSVEFGRGGGIKRRDSGKAIAPYRIEAGTLPQYIFDLLC
jgi:hypothetical protein